MASDDLRLTTWNLHGPAGMTVERPFTVDTPITSLSVYVGGTVTDLDDLTDATAYPATVDPGGLGGTIAVDFPTGSSQHLRLVIDGAVVAVGRIHPSMSGTSSPGDTITIATEAATLALSVPSIVVSTTLIDGDKSDLTVTGDVWTIDAGVVTPAKLSFDPATQAELDAEVVLRTAADSSLSDLISTEQTVRADADTALDVRVDALEASGATAYAELDVEFLTAAHTLIKAKGGTFTPTRSSHEVTVSVSGATRGTAHLALFFAWSQTATGDLLTGDDIVGGAYVAGASYRRLGSMSATGTSGSFAYTFTLDGLTPGQLVTFEVDVAAVGYYGSMPIGNGPQDLATGTYKGERLYVTDNPDGTVRAYKTVWLPSADRQLVLDTTWTTGSAFGICTNPANGHVFVCLSAGSVVELDPADGSTVRSWPITSPTYVHIANDTLFVVRQAAARVVPIPLSTGTAGTEIVVGAGPWKPVSDATYLYVPCSTANRVDRINLTTHATSTLALGAGSAPVAAAVNPANNDLWVLEQGQQRARSVDRSTFTLTGTAITGLGASQADLAVSEEGKSLVIVGGSSPHFQSFRLPYPGVRYESAALAPFIRVIKSKLDGTIYMNANSTDTLHYFHGARLDIDPTDDFLPGGLSVLVW